MAAETSAIGQGEIVQTADCRRYDPHNAVSGKHGQRGHRSLQPFAGQEQLSEHDNYDDRGGQLRQHGGGEVSQPVDDLGGGMRRRIRRRRVMPPRYTANTMTTAAINSDRPARVRSPKSRVRRGAMWSMYGPESLLSSVAGLSGPLTAKLADRPSPEAIGRSVVEEVALFGRSSCSGLLLFSSHEMVT